MAGLDHGPNENVDDRSSAVLARHVRWGLTLFAIYFACYSVFLALIAFAPALARQQVASGINLVLVYGLALIAGAVLLAFLYGWLCRSGSYEGAAKEPR